MAGEMRQQGRLPRIAATLLTLAALAERAALRSLPIRFLVLAILWHAEAIARRFVASEMAYFGDLGEDLDPYIGSDLDPYIDDDLDAPAPCWPSLDELLPPSGFTLDANLLALRLRILASIVMALTDAGAIWEDDCGIDFCTAFGDGARNLLCTTATAAHPLVLVIIYPAARYGIIRPPDTS